MKFNIRVGVEADIPHVLMMIQELALFEKEPNEVLVNEAQLRNDAFGPEPLYHLLIADLEDGTVAGMAMYFYGYSSWKGKLLFLDDLIVKKDYRKNGIGKQLLKRLFKIADENDVQRVKWEVLNWNQPAIQLYEDMGARIEDSWLTCKFNRDQIEHISNSK